MLSVQRRRGCEWTPHGNAPPPRLVSCDDPGSPYTCGVVQMAMAATQHIPNHPSWGKQRAGYIKKLLQPHHAGTASSTPPLHHTLRQLRQVGPMHAPIQMKDVSIGLTDTIPAFCFTA